MVAAPLSDKELLERSDLAGYARVLSRNLPFARIRFTKILKGRPEGSSFLHKLGCARTVVVLLHDPVQPMQLGEWSDAGAYEPGRRIKTHLCWDAASGFYETLWWNGVDTI